MSTGQPPGEPPGRGLLGWLGRQVGHVVKAVRTDVVPPAVPPPATTVYRTEQVQELPHPTQPGVVLRRTTTDEVIVRDGGGGAAATSGTSEHK
jgi:hypothetical protein